MRSLVGAITDAVRGPTVITRPPQPAPRNDLPVPYAARASIGALFQPQQAGSPDAQMRAMGSVGTLFQIVHLLSTTTAEVPWHLWRKSTTGKDEDRVEVTRHAALDLWNQPNGFMPRQEFVEVSQQHLDLTGEAWWVVARGPGKLPLELWPVRPDRMAPVPDQKTYLSGYVYTSPDGERIPLGLDEVIFLRMPNPTDPYRGMGPVQSLLTNLDAVRYTAEWNRNFFANSAEPGGIIQIPAGTRLQDEEFNELSKRWAEQHRGVSNAHRVAIIEHGTWVDRKYTQRDMQFVELQQVGREIIREAFGMHVQFLGGSDVGHSRAEAEAAEVIFARWKVKPRCGRIKGALNAELLKLYGPTGTGLEFDFESPVPPDQAAENEHLTARANAAKTLVEAGYDKTAVLAVVGLPDMAVAAVVPVAAVPAAAPAALLRVPAARLDQHWHALPGPVRNADTPPDLDPSDLPDVGPLQDQWETALAALLAALGPIRDAQKQQLVDEVRRLAEKGRLSDLAGLTVDTADAADAIAAAMEDLAALAAGRVVAEAGDQGVTVKPVVPPAADLAEVAAVAAASLGQLLGLSATAAAMRANGPAATAEHVADAVDEALGLLTDAAPADWCGGALTGAQNAARVETLRAGPVGGVYSAETNDKNTCLAPSTRVATDRGQVRADEVTSTDRLLTHSGSWTRPSRVVISEVDEPVVEFQLCSEHTLTLTADHPVLVLDGGCFEWRNACELSVGALVVHQSSLEQAGELNVPDLALRHAPHGVAPTLQVGRLPLVHLDPPGMPVAPVGLYHQAGQDKEVDGPPTDASLRQVIQVHAFENEPDGTFNASFQPARSVATRGTEAAPPAIDGRDAEVLRANGAGDDDGGAPAGFGAVASPTGLAVPERSSTTQADAVPAACVNGAVARAEVVPACHGNVDVEILAAMGAGLSDEIRRTAQFGAHVWTGELACDGAVDPAYTISPDDLAFAHLAETARLAPGPPAFEGAALFATGGAAVDNGGAVDAVGWRGRHEISVVEVTAIRRMQYRGKVYDFTIPGDETFWAEGVLVHNCSPCKSVNGKWLGNTDQMDMVLASYPGGAYGGYVNCLGRERCRGTVTGVWR